MTPREIVIANLEHTPAPRPGIAFSGDRINDMVSSGLTPSRARPQKSWTEGDKEFYDDEWGNLWWRIADASVEGEIYEPALKDWSQLEDLTLPDYDDPARYDTMRELFSRPTDKFKLAGLPGWVPLRYSSAPWCSPPAAPTSTYDSGRT